MPLCVDQLISSTLNTSQKVDNLLLLDNRYLKQLDNPSVGFLTTVNIYSKKNKTTKEISLNRMIVFVLKVGHQFN
jgi:hypothetical protein